MAQERVWGDRKDDRKLGEIFDHDGAGENKIGGGEEDVGERAHLLKLKFDSVARPCPPLLRDFQSSSSYFSDASRLERDFHRPKASMSQLEQVLNTSGYEQVAVSRSSKWSLDKDCRLLMPNKLED